MAAGTLCKMRLLDIDDNPIQIRTCEMAQKLKAIGFTAIKIITLEYSAAFPNGLTEVSAPNAVFNGTSTPATVFVVSSDAGDTSDGTGVRKVCIIGIDSNDELVIEEVTMAGATDVETTTLWKRIFHAYASEWGANGDADGTIIVESDAEATATYLTIAAGANESDGATIYLPAYHEIAVNTFSMALQSLAAAAHAADWKIARTYCDGSGADPDLDYDYYRVDTSGNGELDIKQCGDFHGATAGTISGIATIKPYNTYIGAAETAKVKCAYILYKTNKKGIN